MGIARPNWISSAEIENANTPVAQETEMKADIAVFGTKKSTRRNSYILSLSETKKAEEPKKEEPRIEQMLERHRLARSRPGAPVSRIIPGRPLTDKTRYDIKSLAAGGEPTSVGLDDLRLGPITFKIAAGHEPL